MPSDKHQAPSGGEREEGCPGPAPANPIIAGVLLADDEGDWDIEGLQASSSSHWKRMARGDRTSPRPPVNEGLICTGTSVFKFISAFLEFPFFKACLSVSLTKCLPVCYHVLLSDFSLFNKTIVLECQAVIS